MFVLTWYVISPVCFTKKNDSTIKIKTKAIINSCIYLFIYKIIITQTTKKYDKLCVIIYT